jgi:hypothetical protein
VSSPVSVAAANSNKPPTCSWYPGSIDKPFLGFFFSRQQLPAQPKAGSDPIELTNADAQSQSLLQQALQRRTGDARGDLAAFY